ncbi:unnamed protein product [Haemonchus placei]|uniref:Uncharacterized protein n=1 Tax=Haemonchus placei TaxID=6290 RepID=A0A3P8BDM4_HAEPC|nr:unnamed protein product [Haemonchus placei]
MFDEFLATLLPLNVIHPNRHQLRFIVSPYCFSES